MFLLNLFPVPLEVFDYILKLHQQDESSKWSHITSVSKVTRQLYTHPTAIKLKNEEKLKAFSEDAQYFATLFHKIWPTHSFCNIRVLQLVIPENETLHATTQALFNCISPTLSELNVVVQDVYMGGVKFMEVLTLWSKALHGLKVLRIKYQFSVQDDVWFILYFFHF